MSEQTPLQPAVEGDGDGGRRIGVYVCHCGGNISDYVDVEKVIADIHDAGDVVVSKTAMFACSDATQSDMVADIQANDLDGLVVASCSPKLHTYTFRGVASRAGLNPYEYTQVNIREQCSWVHTDDEEARDRQGDRARPRGDLAHPQHRPARADGRGHDPAHARHRGRDRRPPGRGRPCRHRAAGDARGAGAPPRWLGRPVRDDVPARPQGHRPHRAPRHRGPQPPPDHGPHRGRGRGQGGQLRQLPDDRSRRRRRRRHDRGRRRHGHRRHRLRHLPARRGRARLRHRGCRDPPRVQGARGRRHGLPGLERPAGPEPRVRLLRRQPQHRRVRQRVLLALLLRRDGPDRGRGLRPGPVDPPVPPLPGHADVRQVRAAVHRGPQGRIRVPQVRQRRAPGRRGARRRRPDRHRP